MGHAGDRTLVDRQGDAQPGATTRRAPRLSVVMPAYNEAANIAAAIDDVVECVFRVVPDAELVVVDDGSRDATFGIASGRADADARVRVVRQVNAGHGPALVHGIRQARGDYCLLVDSDRQIDLAAFASSWRLCDGQCAVFGVRRNRDDPLHRIVLSATLRAALRGLGVRSSDPNAPYKLLPRALLVRAIDAMPAAPRVPSILLTVYLQRRGVPIVEQEVTHRRREAGETTLKPLRLARFCRNALAELLRFHRSLPRVP